MATKSILQPGETAEAGGQLLHGVLWNAVFKRTQKGSLVLLAYVDGPDVAEFFAAALNAQLKG